MNAVIFDFNGTMFFDEKFQYEAWQTYIEEKIGRKATDEEFRDYIRGRNIEETMAYFLGKDVSRDEAIAMEEAKEQIYRRLCKASDKFHLAKGLPEYLDKLAELNIPVNIATASGENNVRFFFEELPLAKWFDFEKVVFNDGTFPGKPAPDIFIRAAERIGEKLEDCVVFEDTKSGILAACNGHAKKVIGVESVQSGESLRGWGADETILDYTEILNTVEKWKTND